MNISSVDLYFLVKEMDILVNQRLQKIYHPNKEELILQFQKNLVRILPGKAIFLSEFKENYPEPSGFCMFLRKHLLNSRLKSIEQVGSERIIELKFNDYSLFVELFGQGNIVLTKDAKILNALIQKKWKDRQVMKGLVYKHPEKDFNLFELKNFDLIGDKEIVIELAKNLGMGGKCAEELCKLAGIDKKAKNVDNSKLYKEFRKLLDKEVKLSSELDSQFKEGHKFISKHQAQIDKTQKIVEQQLQQMKDLDKKSKENNRKGELIYEKYKLVEEILDELKKARHKYSFKEIKEKLKGHKTIKDIDGKNKKISIEI